MPTRHSHNAKQKKVLQALEKTTGLVASACKAAGITRTTFYNWYNTDPEFRSKVDDISELTKDFVESKILQKIKSGDTTAIIFYAKTKMKERGYVEKQEIETNIRSFGDDIIISKKKISREEMIANGIDPETADSLCDTME